MVVWHRSFHEVYLNSAMLEHLEITEAVVGNRQQIDFARGRFYEVGLGYAIGKLNRFIMSPDWIEEGLNRLKRIVHIGGHTTVSDMAVGLFDYEMERDLGRKILDRDDVPFRVLGVPHAQVAASRMGGHGQVIAHVNELSVPTRNESATVDVSRCLPTEPSSHNWRCCRIRVISMAITANG